LTQSRHYPRYAFKVKRFGDIHWPRVLAEGFAIVASILLAFWIQAWWEDRQQGADERYVIESLLADLRQKRSRLQNDRQLTGTIVESGTKLLAAPTDQNLSLDSGAVDDLISDLLWYNTSANWESAPMDSLLFGGDIGHISSVALVDKISALQVMMSRAKSSFGNDARFVDNQLRPYLVANANLQQILNSIGAASSGVPGDFSFPDIPMLNARDHIELLVRDDFRGLVMTKIGIHINAQEFTYSPLESALDEVLTMLQLELEK